MTLRDLVKAFRAEFAEPLRQADYLLADTRIPWVSLYDHLVLTGGIAAAFAEELRRRRKTPEEICGLSLDPSELRHLACLCGLLHDLGKARVGETEYRFHVQRGVEYATEWLTAKGVDGHLQEIIVGSIARHHLRDGPQTLFEKLVCLADSYASAGDRPELGRASTLEEFLRVIRGTEQLEQELFEGFHHPALNDIDSPMSPGMGNHVRGLNVDYTWTARGLRVTECGLDHPDGPFPPRGVSTGTAPLRTGPGDLPRWPSDLRDSRWHCIAMLCLA